MPQVGRAAVGNRVGCCSRQAVSSADASGAIGKQIEAADRRSARPARQATDATQHDRVELRATERRGEEAVAGGKEAVEAGEVGLRTAGAIWRFWFVRSLFTEGREHLARALSMPHSVLQACSLSSRAKTLNGAGYLAWGQRDYSSARSLL